ncbi:MAG TPA: hypothetical protein VGC00_14545 [Thermoanaerobaculia bacterium]|jgi:hypothetical protein
MARWLRTASLVAAALVVVAPASATVYVIQLHGGGTFETRFEPQDASYDAGKIIFLDELGVLVALDKADVATIESDVEVSGFGHVIDDTTIALGWAPNDAPEVGSAQDQARQAAIDAENAGPSGPAPEPIYDVENVPATMQIIPSFTAEGPSYVIPAPAPPPAEPPGA